MTKAMSKPRSNVANIPAPPTIGGQGAHEHLGERSMRTRASKPPREPPMTMFPRVGRAESLLELGDRLVVITDAPIDVQPRTSRVCRTEA